MQSKSVRMLVLILAAGAAAYAWYAGPYRDYAEWGACSYVIVDPAPGCWVTQEGIVERCLIGRGWDSADAGIAARGSWTLLNPPPRSHRRRAPMHGSTTSYGITCDSIRPLLPAPPPLDERAPSPGILRLRVTPRAELFLDGRSRGARVGFVETLPAGTVQIRLVPADDGFRDSAFAHAVASGYNPPLLVRLQRK